MKLSATLVFIIGAAAASAQTTYTVSILYTFPASNTGPTGITVDSKGNIYSAGNFAAFPNAPGIAQIFAPTSSNGNGSAVLFAGGALNGSNDGSGSAAQFSFPEGMATDAAGNIYVADVQSLYGGGTVREIVPTTGTVTTLSGLNGTTQIFNSLGGSSGGFGPDGVAVSASGNIYVTIGGTTPDACLAQYVPGGSPISISTGQSVPQHIQTYGIAVDSSNDLYVTCVGSPPATDVNGVFEFSPAQLFVVEINGSSASQLYGLPVGANSMLEPNLGQLTGPVPIAVDNSGNIYVGWYGNLYLYNSQGGPTEIATIGGPIVGLATDSSGRIYVASGPPGYLSSNIYGPGLLSVVAPPGVSPLPSTPTPTPTPTPIQASHFINISTRAFVGIGGSVAIAGFTISGGANEQVLIRGVGPSLSIFSVSGVLAQPVLALFNSSGTQLATNTGWGTNSNSSQVNAAFAATGAFALPSGSADSALLVSLAPGSYTAQVSGLNNTTGNALIEVYQVPTPTPTPTPIP
jgi:sugar lactone lactonase YvrE